MSMREKRSRGGFIGKKGERLSSAFKNQEKSRGKKWEETHALIRRGSTKAGEEKGWNVPAQKGRKHVGRYPLRGKE